jgi:hypothetical protein
MWFLKRESKKLTPDEEWARQRDKYLRNRGRLSPEFEAYRREREKLTVGQSFRS